MEVQLYVYDLTRGMARAMSRQVLGTQIDAVYHTSLVFGNIEYFFGMGVQTCYPGSTHHGQPMEVIPMGTSHLPIEVVLEYLESLKEVYTPESYDLFAHNCNNFTNDFAMFLVGTGIPDHITNLPKRVLDTPFGQMLKPQIDAGMRSMTQAPVPPQNPLRAVAANETNNRPQHSNPNGSASQTNGVLTGAPAYYGKVKTAASKTELDQYLQSASNTIATIFFTSSTCAPCRIACQMYDQLAEQHRGALFLKVDIGSAQDVALHYQVRATPTFMTFAKGTKQDAWSGADPNILKSNVESLIQQTVAPHPHTLLRVPNLQYGSQKPLTYAKIPPLDKLMAKLGSAAADKEMVALRSFAEKRGTDAKEAPLPDLRSIGNTFQTKVLALPPDVRFAAVDLLRCAMIDTRVSGFFAEEQQTETIPALIKHVNCLDDCPHSLRLVTIHLACNLFASPLYVKELMRKDNTMTGLLIQLITSSLLDPSHPTARVAAASLAFNLAVANHRVRREEKVEALGESEQVELAASIIETLSTEDNSDATKALLLALGYLLYCAPFEGELMDLVKALNAKAIIIASKGNSTLAKEVASLV